MKLILTSYDFSQNQIRNVVLHNASPSPSNPVAGQIYYNTTNNLPYYYNNTAWTQFGSVTGITLSFGATTSSIFDVSGADSQSISTSGTFDISLNTQLANRVMAGPSTGSPAAPTFRALVAADIPSLSGVYLPLAGGTMAGVINMNGNTITNLGLPTNSADAASKSYVDSLLDGRKWKQAVTYATTANIASLSGEQTIDGGTTSTSRVLVKNQTNQTQNGIYVTGSGAWTRATDADVASELEGAAVSVLSGSTNANTQWFQTTFPVTLGSSNIIWALTNVGAYTADGQGIEVSANNFSLELDGTTLSKSGTGLKVADGGITSTQLAASVAGNGLSGGAGSALAVNAGTGITISSDNVNVTSYTPLSGWTVARILTGNFTVTSAGAFSQQVSVSPFGASDVLVQLRNSSDEVIEADIDTTISSGNITIAGVAPTSSYNIKYIITA